MRIGIDIDGVLTDIERFMIDYGSKFFIEKNLPLKLSPGFYDDVKILNCTEEQAVEFWEEYIIYYFTEYKPRDFSAQIIKKLKEEGHEIYIITGRNEYGVPREYIGKIKEMTEQWLKENDIIYDKLIYTEGSKLPYCIGNYIELLIEDWSKVLKEVSKKIPVICFDCYYNAGLEGEKITRAYSWYDVYNKIKTMK